MIVEPFSDELLEYPFVVLRPDNAWIWFAVDPRYPESLDEFEEFVVDWDMPARRC